MAVTAAEISRGKTNGRAAATPAQPAESLERIRVDQVDVGENVRIQPGDLDDMAASILEHGVLSPVKVVGPHKDGRYKLVYGQRRLLASAQAGVALIPAIVVPVGVDVDHPGAKRSIEQLVENLQRADLNPIDEAKALRQVLDADPELTQDELGKRLGRSAPWVSNTLRLLDLAPAVQAFVSTGQLSQSHAKAIAGLKDHKNQERLAENAVKYDYSAKSLESQVGYERKNNASEPERQELLRSKGERLGKRMLKVLAAAGIPKDAQLFNLSSYDADVKATIAVLKAAGYTGGRGGYGSYSRRPDGCDCSVYRWDSYAPASFRPVCANREHEKAAQATEDQREQQRVKELKDKAKRLRAVLECGLAGIDATAGRLAIAAIFGSNLGYHLGGKGDPWEKLEALADDSLPRELAELIASTLIPTEKWGRTADSAGLHSTINKLAAAPAASRRSSGDAGSPR